MKNIDTKVVEDFGKEWSRFTQGDPGLDKELILLFDKYFSIFPWNKISKKSIGFDLGCGSGRWAKFVAPKVAKLYCIDPAQSALNVSKKNLAPFKNVEFRLAGVDSLDFIPDQSMDFGYSLGVLHHIPRPVEGLSACIKKLKKGAPFLVYLYYAFDNRPLWFKILWKISNFFRFFISKLPSFLKNGLCYFIAIFIYYPLAKTALFLEKKGINAKNFPLSFYKDKSLYTMKTDALDRFGTRLEHRFTKEEIRKMMEMSGLKDIVFRESEPYWCALGYRK